ncbi:MAG: hypothetical protein CM15mP77_0130 [Synechococcus sp.]|nr:MAG: hypothetical protein CM15mP77_0130 [Synechococcus sp.]
MLLDHRWTENGRWHRGVGVVDWSGSSRIFTPQAEQSRHHQQILVINRPSNLTPLLGKPSEADPGGRQIHW